MNPSQVSVVLAVDAVHRRQEGADLLQLDGRAVRLKVFNVVASRLIYFLPICIVGIHSHRCLQNSIRYYFKKVRPIQGLSSEGSSQNLDPFYDALSFP